MGNLNVLVVNVSLSGIVPDFLDTNSFDFAYVVDAPTGLVEALVRTIEVRHGKGTQAQFQAKYVETLEPLLACRTSSWANQWDDGSRELLSSSMLPALNATWKVAELLKSIADFCTMTSSLSITYLSDSNTDDVVLRELYLGAGCLGGYELKHVECKNDSTPSAKPLSSRLPRRLRDILRDSVDAVSAPRNHFSQSPEPSGAVFFLAESARMWAHVDPVYRACISRGIRGYAFVTRTSTERQLQKSGVRTFRAKLNFASPKLRRSLADLVRAAPLRQADTGKATERWHHALRGTLYRTISPYLNRVYSVQSAVNQIVRQNRRAVFLHPLACYHPLANTLSASAARNGARMLQMPHGLVDYSTPEFGYFPYADRYYAWGQMMIDGYAKSAWPHGQTEWIAAGSPLQEMKLKNIPPARSGDAVLITFGRASHVLSRRAFEAAVDEVFDAAKRHPAQQFVVKPHPSDKSGFWSRRLGPIAPANMKIDTADFYELLATSNVIVTMHSTAGAEAILTDRPVAAISIDLGEMRSPKRPDYVNEGAAFVVEHPGGLSHVLDELAAAPFGHDRLAPARAKFSERFLFRSEQPAAERIAGLIAEEMGSKSRQ